MTNSKMTNKKALNYVLDNFGEELPVDVVEKVKAMILAIEKKSNAPKKLTAKQEANATLKEKIVAFLSANEGSGFTASELLKAIPEFEGDSNQHISALLRALRLEGIVGTYTEKRKTYFTLANGEEIEIEVEGE